MSKTNSFALIPQTDKKMKKRIKLVPPDGGWGWMVLLGTALTNIFNQSMLSLCTFLYGDALEAMGYATQGAALVLSTMLFVSNLGGPIAGAVVKLSSPRFVSVTGAVCCSVGILFSGFSTNIWHLVLTYGILLGLGLGFIQNASFVSINGYFKERKSLAVGLAMAGTGVGQTLMPHVVRYLLENFGFKGACLLLAALSLHGICGTLLLQPVEWHMKKVEEEVEVDEKMHLLEDSNKDAPKTKDHNANGNVTFKGTRRATEPTLCSEIGAESPKKSLSQSNKELQVHSNGKSIEKLNGNYVVPTPKKTMFRKIYDLFDISLLSSPRFINVIVGTAITVVSIQNFSMLYPLFLQKKVFLDKQQTANCMSAVALADIVGRLTLPMFQDKYHIKARTMLIMTSIWLIVVRQILAYQTDVYVLLAMSALYGFGRSMVIVARNIAISDQCRMDQVPSAVGLGMLSIGIIVPPAGLFLGWIRDYTDSYIICITAQNLFLVVFLAMWIPDMLYLYYQEKREKRKKIEQAIS
ncbi:monocarboxylate transporter 12 [Bicyclus anynana]|uniref:Monocarboxylate transporter 12 n=1 Tax=Bicyclus anynana TaxID=110368 RepID=A0A6J1P4E4_BICAN|nr:monocarboxylate transporter 12 [Bicyclus anynana]XP_052739336.1 monocarboxylate transporter 12 [Bicyclus anynana]